MYNSRDTSLALMELPGLSGGTRTLKRARKALSVTVQCLGSAGCHTVTSSGTPLPFSFGYSLHIILSSCSIFLMKIYTSYILNSSLRAVADGRHSECAVDWMALGKSTEQHIQLSPKMFTSWESTGMTICPRTFTGICSWIQQPAKLCWPFLHWNSTRHSSYLTKSDLIRSCNLSKSWLLTLALLYTN